MALPSAVVRLPSPRRLARRLSRWVRSGVGGDGRRSACRPISLALQGGGAHGAFTWGVLDRLLEDERLAVEALSGASAGAMNAVILAAGWLDEGRDGARAALAAFWRRVADAAALSPLNPALVRRLSGPFRFDASAPQLAALGLVTRLVSPYQFNPLQLNPLRRILTEAVDFERLRRTAAGTGPELFIAATSLRDGRSRVFRRHELSADAVLASACLPSLHHAVEIEGEPYWDGGFSRNPPLLPLVVERPRAAAAGDIVLVQINPISAAELPVSAPAILNRVNEIVFNAPLLAELDALALGARLARDGFRLGGGDSLRRRLARLRLHRIDGGEVLRPLGAASKLHPDWSLLTHMRDRGREAAERWLAEHYPALGRRSTLDLAPPPAPVPHPAA